MTRELQTCRGLLEARAAIWSRSTSASTADGKAGNAWDVSQVAGLPCKPYHFGTTRPAFSFVIP
jgi:hypothetical protein